MPRFSGCPFWAKILLLVSLTGNLIVAGLIIGHQLRPRPISENNWMMSIVPVEKRETAQELFAKRRSRIQELRQQRSELRNDMLSTFQAETFSPETMAEKMESHRMVTNEQRALIHEQLVELFAMMSHDERVTAAERMQRLFAKRPSSDDN
ncbi:periplasmic heavy metal sensor [Rhodobacteraceae bacterium NNCM2]|nr:periplasmic heavy metal sensor [Coraliihabitans acroporae]